METPPCPRYDCLLLGMTFPRELLCRRIDERLQRRIDDGMIEEVANLRANGARDLFLEGLGLEYRYILWYLTGRIPTLDALQDELGRAIKRFAKRQDGMVQKGPGCALAGYGGRSPPAGGGGHGGISGAAFPNSDRKSLPNHNLFSVAFFDLTGILVPRNRSKEITPCGSFATKTTISTVSTI